MGIFEKFNNMIDLEGLKNDLKEVAANGLDFKEIEPGKYEVKIDKLELKESKKGQPMVSGQFAILVGENKGQKIFFNQVVSSGFGLHKANEFLNSLKSGVDVEFKDFEQYSALITNIFVNVYDNCEYLLNYTKNDKGFFEYKIEEVFEV